MASNPIRTCMACRKKGSKENFIKIVKNKNGTFAIDKDKVLEGRGCYICNSQECFDKCLKTKALNRAFKTNVPIQIYEELKNGDECK